MSLFTRVKELRTEKKTLADEANGLVALAAKDKRSMTADEREKFEKIHARIEGELTPQIADLERQIDLDASLSESRGVRAGRADSDPEDGEPHPEEPDPAKRLIAERAAFVAWTRGGVAAMTPEQRNAQLERTKRYGPELRALSAVSNTAGAYTIAEGFYPQLISAQKAFGGMNGDVCTEFTTSTGAPLPIVTDNDTTNEGEILAENTAAAEQDVTVGQVILGAYAFSSKLVKVPIQLLQDSEFDIEAWLFAKFGERMGRRKNRAFTTGTGANEPYGIVTQAAVGKTAAATGAITWLELIGLKHSVDPAYRVAGPRWMFNDASLLAIKSLQDGQGRPLWQSGVALREPDLIDGDAYVINQDMASMATTTKPILYGDLKHYYIRNVQGAIVLALRERYAEALQVGFLAFSRHDGVLVDAGTNPVKVLQMA